MKSPKQISLEKQIFKLLSGKALKAAHILVKDEEVRHLQEYANLVAITRLHYNDHGPVHMRTVALNALVLFDLLHQARIPGSLEKEKLGTYEDSRTAVFTASFLHDIGMTVGRDNHEQTGVTLAVPIIGRVLEAVYPEDRQKQVVLCSLVLEGIAGHMGVQKISSLEAGTILVADGCDMEKGRARIPLLMDTASQVGDIHKYSSAAIQQVTIGRGGKKPVKISVEMKESVGFFQVEEVLLQKINASPVKPYIELFAQVEGQKVKQYL